MTQRRKNPAESPDREPSFGEAVEEVEGILARLEAQEIDIDDLSREVRRAVELIKLCRGKLERTDRDVRELVADLDGEAGRRAVAEAAEPAGPGETPAPDRGPARAAGGDLAPGEDEDLPF